MKNILYILLFFTAFSFGQNKGLKLAIEAQGFDCVTISSGAGVDGYKVWCWDDDDQVSMDINAMTEEAYTTDNNLRSSVHFYNGQSGTTGPMYVENGRLYFKLDPNDPLPSGEPLDYNYRREIRDNPSNVSHALGTEQWWGFDYKFEDSYVIDDLPWIMWQTHADYGTPAPPMQSLQISETDYSGETNQMGELLIRNDAFNAASPKATPTGIIPQAGQTLRVVIRVIWGDEATGLFQVWVDDVLVYNENERTVYTVADGAPAEEGGYFKIGIYKWRWASVNSPTAAENIAASEALGVFDVITSIGPLRVITRGPSNPDNGKCPSCDFYKMRQ